jgi:hypothetical protein
MIQALKMNADVRALTLDELEEVSGGKGKQPTGVTVERCTTTHYPDGREVQKCKVVSETIL